MAQINTETRNGYHKVVLWDEQDRPDGNGKRYVSGSYSLLRIDGKWCVFVQNADPAYGHALVLECKWGRIEAMDMAAAHAGACERHATHEWNDDRGYRWQDTDDNGPRVWDRHDGFEIDFDDYHTPYKPTTRPVKVRITFPCGRVVDADALHGTDAARDIASTALVHFGASQCVTILENGKEVYLY